MLLPLIVKMLALSRDTVPFKDVLKQRTVDYIDIAVDECSPHHFKVFIIIIIIIIYCIIIYNILQLLYVR